MTNSIKKQVYERIEKSEIGKPFIYNDFIDIASLGNIKMILIRLMRENKIVRLLDGIYVRPYFNDLINKHVFPSVYDVANAIARKNNWQLFPSANSAMNLVGFSTQVPANYEFICDGGYRSYNYRNTTIHFIKSNRKKIGNISKELATLVIALDEVGKKNVDHHYFGIALRYAKEKIPLEEIKLEKIKVLPNWIFEILNQIRKEYPQHE